MKNSRGQSERWLRDAEHTLRQAERTLGDDSYNWVCFLAEQACQKSLKAVQYFDGARFITIHSIAELLKQVAVQHPEFSKFSAQGVKLDQYYLSSRYPDAVAEPAIPSEIFVEEQAEEALAIARRIFEASRRVIAP